MPLLSRPRRPRRAGDWSSERAVTFIVTLAAHRSVTLAARAARMSRKSAYALKARDFAFAAAWNAAVKASALDKRQGDKMEGVEDPPVSSGQGDMSPSRIDRERSFAGLLAQLRESPALAPRRTGQ